MRFMEFFKSPVFYEPQIYKENPFKKLFPAESVIFILTISN